MHVLLASLLWLIASSCSAQAFNSPGQDAFGTAGSASEFLPVEEAYQLEVEVPAAQKLRLYWQIADSYYLYQHRFSFKLEDSAGPVELAVELPPALQRNDEYFGEVHVYYNQADIQMELARPTQGRWTCYAWSFARLHRRSGQRLPR